MIGAEISYLYRDASNYKFRARVHVSGRLSKADLMPFMIDGTYFIPDAVGMKGLQPTERNEDDHDLHEIVDITATRILSDQMLMPAEILISRFKRTSHIGWFANAPSMD